MAASYEFSQADLKYVESLVIISLYILCVLYIRFFHSLFPHQQPFPNLLHEEVKNMLLVQHYQMMDSMKD